MRNQGVLLAVAISFLVIAFVFIYVSQYYIPHQDQKIADTYKNLYLNRGVFVVVGDDGLQEGTLITEDLFREGTIKIQNIPSDFIPKKDGQELVYTTGSEFIEGTEESAMVTILNKVVKSKIEPGSLITYASLGEGSDVVVDSFEKQIQLNVENTVGNNLKTGKYVDIITKYQNGEYDGLASKVMIDSVISTGVVEPNPDTGEVDQAQLNAKTKGIILVSVNDREYRDIELGERLGTLSIRLYKSIDQYASPVTFNYAAKIGEVNKNITDLELVGAHDKFYDEYGMLISGKGDVSNSTEMFVYLEWYADIYYKLKPYLEDGVRIYEKQEDIDEYTLVNAEDPNIKPTILLKDLAEAADVKELDTVIALILGNEKVYSASNRLEIFNNYMKDKPETITGIRVAVANQLVSKVLDYYTKIKGTDTDSLATLIQNGFITSSNFDVIGK